MNGKHISAFALSLFVIGNIAFAQTRISDIPYVENGHERQVLDIYTPDESNTLT